MRAFLLSTNIKYVSHVRNKCDNPLCIQGKARGFIMGRGIRWGLGSGA